MSMKSTPRLLPFFVYGTLLPGQPNAHLWGDSIVSQQNATLANGRLYDLGAFPMLVEEDEEMVVGCLITVQPWQYQSILAHLDELEGYDPAQPAASAYRREQRDVLGEDGRSHSAWVYIGHATALPDMMHIPSGDWRRHVAATFQDVDEWWQTVQSVHGMLKPPEPRGAA